MEPATGGTRQEEADRVVATLEHFLDNVEVTNDRLNTFAALTPPEKLRREAESSVQRWRAGAPLSSLDGVLVSVKDNIARRGEPCRLGSAARPDVPAEADAPVMANLLAAGMIVVGRTTMPDHGCKGTTHGGLHGTARNPWNTDLTPGGSSGGAGASVAAGLTRVAVGSDGGGSIRIPAAFCGIVGLKPTFGRVPVSPGGPFAAIGHTGPLGASVRDVAALLDVISGQRAPRTAPVMTGADLDGLRFAVWADSASTDPAIVAGVRRAADALTDLGAVAVPRTVDFSAARRAWEVAFCAGAAAAVEALPSPDGSDPVLLRLAELGRAFTGDDLARAEAQRQDARSTVQRLFAEVDVVLSPVTECLPFEVEHEAPPGSGITMFHEWSPWTHPFNVTGNPAISVPTGLSESRLPTAVQVVAGLGNDGLLLRVAAHLEAVLGSVVPPRVA